MSTAEELKILDRISRLVESDSAYLTDLIAIRHYRGMSVEQVANLCGLPVSEVEEFERELDGRMSLIRNYANMVGALVVHDVNRYVDVVAAERAEGEGSASAEAEEGNHG